MTATSHAIIGTVIAAKVGDPVLAVPLAVISHFLADIFPHWDSGTHKATKSKRRFFYESVADVLLSGVASLFLLTFVFPETNIFYAGVIIFCAQLPDWLHSFSVYLGWNFPPFSWFHAISQATNTKLDKPWGILLQIWAVLLVLAYGIFT